MRCAVRPIARSLSLALITLAAARLVAQPQPKGESADDGASAALGRRPNILLILPDQMRGSAMGCAGNPEVKTPHIDLLAAEGVRFRRTYANVPVCCPARAILMTGTYPHVNGMVANDLRLRESEVTIAEILRDAGYRTGFVGKRANRRGRFDRQSLIPSVRPPSVRPSEFGSVHSVSELCALCGKKFVTHRVQYSG